MKTADWKPGRGGNKKASLIGERWGKKAQEKGIKKVAFDRSGFMFHSRVKHWQSRKAIWIRILEKRNS